MPDTLNNVGACLEDARTGAADVVAIPSHPGDGSLAPYSPDDVSSCPLDSTTVAADVAGIPSQYSANRKTRTDTTTNTVRAATVVEGRGPEPRPNYLDVGSILAAPDEPLDFVLPGLLAGTVGNLVSAGGTGKSMLAMGLALSIAAGRDVWGLIGSDPRQGPVLILSLEDAAVVLGQRLRAFAKSRPEIEPVLIRENLVRIDARQGTNFVLATLNRDKGLEPSSHYRPLRSELERLRPRLIVIDTLNRALGGIAENDNGLQGLVTSLTEALIAPTRTAALVLHHTSKNAALAGLGDLQQSARGASAITDNARFQMNLVGMNEKEAEERNISEEERRRWVKAHVSKANYSLQPADRWLRRSDMGVLVGDELRPQLKEPAARSRKRSYASD